MSEFYHRKYRAYIYYTGEREDKLNEYINKVISEVGNKDDVSISICCPENIIYPAFFPENRGIFDTFYNNNPFIRIEVKDFLISSKKDLTDEFISRTCPNTNYIYKNHYLLSDTERDTYIYTLYGEFGKPVDYAIIQDYREVISRVIDIIDREEEQLLPYQIVKNKYYWIK